MNPLYGLMRTFFLLLSGRIEFLPASKGRMLTMEDGKTFEVFRHVRIKPSRKAGVPGAAFVVRFKPHMSIGKNIKFSLLPMLILMGFKGFREKYWAVERDTGLCQGLYQWQSREDAENYARSIAMRFMAGRSVPGTVQFEIIDQSGRRISAFEGSEQVLGRKEALP
jgi:hypothetical protein